MGKIKAVFGKKYLFKIAKTERDITRVYRIGPPSCMKGSAKVAAYADGDLAVAYMEHIITKRITARAVVWPDKKLYYRIYGSSKERNRLNRSLAHRGYKPGRLIGARISKNHPYGFPSIDGAFGGFEIKGNYLIIK